MLKLLSLTNLAVIERLQIEFRPGLNILSGETGSGKSIIVDALGLLLGNRVSQDVIRTGESRAFVEGVFSCEGNRPMLELLSEAGIEVEDEEEIVIKREIQAGGRSRSFINHQAATLNLIKAVQPHLIDIHGQGEQQSLLSPEAHLNMLDSFGGGTTLRRRTELAYEQVWRLAQELESARRSESERLQLLDMLEYQVAELERAGVRPGEDAELEAERNILANTERLATLCAEAYDLIYEQERCLLSDMRAIERRLSELAQVDGRFSAYLEQLDTAKYFFEDLAYFLRSYAESIHYSPERLKEVEARLMELSRLKRKYGTSLEAILEVLDRLKGQREELQSSEEREKQLEEQLRSAIREYISEAEQLSQLRRRVAHAFEQTVVRELSEVALEEAQFSVRFAEPAGGRLADKLRAMVGGEELKMGRAGMERAEFFFSANKGEAPKPLSGVASGGELSRLMLVLKTVAAPALFPRTLIFDEIDAGIGGRVAEAVGQRLKRLAETNQVLCVTHQAQIARYADAHFRVVKEVVGERTVTGVVELDGSERVEEVARMIGGAEITPLARRHARQLLRGRG